MNSPTKVLFEALRCLLSTSAMDSDVEKPNAEFRKIKREYIESTVKMIDELLEGKLKC